MGQGCSGNIRDIASAAAEAAGQSNTVTQGSTNIIENKKHSFWKQINNDRINELIENLSSEEFQTLLWIFRATCYSNRKTITNTNITTTNNKSSSSTVHTVNNSWKRIFLCDNQLLQLFPSLHPTHITCILEGLSMSLPDTMINQTIPVGECLLKMPLICSNRLMCAFQCSNYLYNARDTVLIDAVVKQIATTAPMTGVNTTTATTSGSSSSSQSIPQLHTALSTTTINNTHIHNNTHTHTTTTTTTSSTSKETPANELLFQDFCFTIALCRHGTLFEQLAFLFVLFAEPCDNIGNTAPVSVPIPPAESLTTTGTAPVSVPVPPTESQSSRATPTAGAADDCGVSEHPQSGAHPDSEVPCGEIELAGVNNDTEVVAVVVPTDQTSPVHTETLTPPAAVTGDAAVQQPPPTSTTTTTSTQPLPPPPLKTRMFSFSSSRTGTVPERTYLESRQLTETGAARLLLFLLLQRLKTLCPALSVVYSKVFSPVANMYVQSRPAWELRQELLTIDWADNEALNTQEIQCILELSGLLASYGDFRGGGDCSSRSSAGRGLSYVDFLRICLCSVSDVHLPTTTGTTTAISMLQNGAGAWVSQNVRCSLQELVHDVLFSTVQIQRLAIAHYATTVMHKQLQCCMSVLGTPQPPPSKDRSEFDVFLLEAGLFLKWCKAMGVIPIFPTAQQKGLISASVAGTKKATKKKRSTTTIVDAVQCVQHLVIQLQPCSETQHSTTLPLGKLCLQNRQLVVQNSQGTWQLKPASLAQPYTQPYIPAEGSANIPHTTPTHHLLHPVDSEVVQYVLVPYMLGKVLYESCDPTAASLPASTFRRTLRFASTARPIEDPTESMPAVSDRPSSLSPGMGPGDRDALQSLGPTATQLVHNFQAHTVAVYEAYPLLLPLHLCTALGAATEEAVTVLNCSWRPPTHPYAPESCVLTTTHSSSSMSATVYAVTLQDVLMQVTKLVLSAQGAETVLGDSDLQQCCRMWGLFPSTSAAATTNTTSTAHNTTVRVQHSAEHEWRLLSSTAADYSAPFSQALGRSRRLMSARQNGHRNGRSTGAPTESACLGLMLEFSCLLLHSTPVPAPGLGVWPTDRVTWGQGFASSTTTGQDGALVCPYKIAEQVDVLTDRNQWQVGVVTNILRDRDSGASHIAVRLLHDGETRHTPVVPVPRVVVPPVLCCSDSNVKHVSPQQSSVTTAEEHRHTYTDEKGVVVENGHTQDIHPVATVGSGSERHAGNTALHRAYSGDSRDSDIESAVNSTEQEVTHTAAQTADAALVESVDSSAEYSDEGEGSDESELEDASVQRPIRPATNTTASRPTEQHVHATTTDHIQQQLISADANTVLSPNGVTYMSTTNTVQRGVIMLHFHSVRILKLGTMTGLSAVYGSFPHPTCSTSGSSAVVQCLLRQAQQFRQQAQEADRWFPVAALTVPLLPASAHLSRQSSLISEGSSIVGKSSLSAAPRSFLGRGSVAPISSVEYLEDHSVASAGQVGDVTDLSVPAWSVEELYELRRFLQYTAECPLSLQALSAMHYTEFTLLHHNTYQALPTGETYPDRSVAPDTTQYIPESSRSLSGTVPSSRPTVTITASAGGGYRKQRNPFALCLKSISKSIQHSLVPHPATSSARRGSRGSAVSQTEARDTLRGLGDTAQGTRADGVINTSESDGAGTGAVIGDRIGGPGHTDPVFPHQQSYSGYSNRGTPSVGSAVGRANTTPISTWDSSSSSNSSGKATKTGIRIIGVAGLNNLGNTCFMSAALQCLLRTPLLVSYFQTSQYRTDLSARSVLGSKGKVTEEFAKVLRVLFALPSVPKKSLIPPAVALAPTLQHSSTTSSMHQQASGIVPDPSHTSHAGTVCLPPQPAPSTAGRNIVYQNYSLTTLLRTFQTHKPQFSGADQQDAQEFFSELLDTFHEDLKVAPSTVPVVPPTPLPTPVATVLGATAAGAVQNRLSVKDKGLHAVDNNPPVTMDGAGTSTSADLGAAAVAELNLLTTAERDSPTVAADPNMTVQQQGELRWQKYLSTNSSIISHLFQGQMCSKIVCKLCGTSSATFEPFTTLSMPIPRLRSMSLSPGSELTTVIITVHRKMPRLSQILRLPDKAFANSVLTQSVFYDIYNATRQPIKLMLQFPRYASLEQVTTKAIQVYNGYEANCSVGYTGMGGSNSGSSTTETVAQHHHGASDTPISRTGSQKQSSQSQLRTETENDAEVPISSGQNGKSHRHNSTTATTTAGTTTATSIPSIPPLVPINTIIIDVNDKQKGRFGKMLDKRDTLQALQDDTTGECHLQLQERCKDITFVASLQASRLSLEYERRYQEQLAQQPSRSLSCQYTSLLDYFDSAEYNPQNVLYNNSMESEGHLLADFDHTYDPSSYPAQHTNRSGDSSVVLASHARRQSAENIHLAAQTDTSRGSSKLGGTAAKLAAQKLQEDTIAAQQRSTDYSYSNSKTWPSSLAQFQIGDRLDAVDYKGTWYPGSIIDILYLTEKDIKTHALSRYTRDFTGGRGTSGTAAPPLKQPCTAGLHLRVHFDGFKATWDEWYDQRDFDAGYLLPVYSKASRKLKMHEIPVIQRRVSYVTSPVSIAAEQQTDTTTDTVASLSIEILDTPSFIQAESYRSCAHLYHHLHEQLLRYVDVDQLMDTIVRPVGDQNMPFSIRLLSFDNLLIPPVDHYCPVVTNSLSSKQSSKQEGQECCIGVSNTSSATEISIADRFNGHKAWEGCAMPMDIARPVINIYHNKLAIGVDWFTPTTTTTTAATSVSHSIANSNTVPVLMHDRMLYRHDPSYTYYLQLQQQKAIAAAQVAAQKQREQQLQENAVRAEVQSELADRDRHGGGSSSGRAAVVQAEEQLMQQAYESDPRAGLTLEDVLSKFVRSEDIEEYHCSHCKRLTPGKLHFSVHTLPDILLLHLQRLVITSTGGGKIRTLVKFPLSRLDMQPFTTEQKERVAALADSTHSSDHTEHLLQQLGTADSSSNSKDMYELYGVVNHIGGMHGGHYTAVSKVEEAVVQDIVSERCFGHTSCSSGGGNNNHSGSEVWTDKAGLHQGAQQETTKTGDGLSLSELIASQWSHVSDTAQGSGSAGFDSTTATTSATTTTAEAWTGLSAQSSKLPSPHSLKWMKFDDEFVNALPSAGLYNSVVTESAFLLFYKRKQLSEKNILKYL